MGACNENAWVHALAGATGIAMAAIFYTRKMLMKFYTEFLPSFLYLQILLLSAKLVCLSQ